MTAANDGAMDTKAQNTEIKAINPCKLYLTATFSYFKLAVVFVHACQSVQIFSCL